MITTELYKGQGLGNQLACYVATRVIALDNGYDFGIGHPERFKGGDFLNLDFGKQVIGGKGPEGGPPIKLPDSIKNYYVERGIFHPITGDDMRTYDKDLVSVLDSTKIDGIMQDEQYIVHRKEEIRGWLKVKETFDCYDYADDNTCVINFRGGEYARHPKFFLTKTYWENAVAHMRTINQNFRFIVITDDVLTAKSFFPDFSVFHFSIGKDYSIIKNAHYLILSNSTFAWFPAWLSTRLKYCLAPKYFARHNVSDGYWSLGYNMTTGWHYLDKEGVVSTYETCKDEFNHYIHEHPDYFPAPKINKNFLVVSNYNNDLRWVPEFTENYLIYDRSEKTNLPDTIDISKVRKSPNIGYNLYDYFTFIIDHYDNLPNCTVFAKGCTFPRHVQKEHFLKVMNNECFTPIEDWKMYKPRFPIAFFSADGGYCEINNSWYTKHWKTKYFKKYNDFLRYSYKDPVIPRYTRFAPGANYIVPKENILKLPKIFYRNLRFFISHTQLPGEAHIIERAMHTLWTSNFELNPDALKLVDESFTLPYKDFKTRLKEKTPVGLKNIIKSIINTTKNTISFLKQPFDLYVEKQKRKTWLSQEETITYRKKIKVYDAFNFFNELELLEIRLSVLDPYVDYFVLIESTMTHSGLPKDLYYEKNKSRFAKFNHKIKHFIIKDPIKSFEDAYSRLIDPTISEEDKATLQEILTSDNIQSGQTSFLRDFYEKEYVKKALLSLDLKDDDFCYVSDLDEIWNPEVIIDYSKNVIYKYKQLPYMYYLNIRSNENWHGWTGTIATKFKNIRTSCLGHLRTFKKNSYNIVKNGGWHFSFMGGVEKIKTKIESYSHQEINTETVKKQITEKLYRNTDIRGRGVHFWVDEQDLPVYLLSNKKKYESLFKKNE